MHFTITRFQKKSEISVASLVKETRNPRTNFVRSTKPKNRTSNWEAKITYKQQRGTKIAIPKTIQKSC